MPVGFGPHQISSKTYHPTLPNPREENSEMFLILTDGLKYEYPEVPEGANPDRIIEEKHSGYALVGDANTEAEAKAKGQSDRDRRKPDSW
jgi:hypothetical protein